MSPRKLRLVLTILAVEDVQDISIYGGEQWGRADSARYVSGLFRAFDRIRSFPNLGRETVDPPTDVRSLSYVSHVIYYRLTDSDRTIEVLRILHAQRDASRHLGQS